MAGTGSSASGTTLYNRQVAVNSTRDRLDPQELGAKERVAFIDHTLVAADGTGSTVANTDEINLCVLPAGATIDLKRTYFKCSADLGDAANLELGFRAHTNPDGTAVAEDSDGICTFADLGNSSTLTRHYFGTGESSITAGATATPLGTVKLNSRSAVTLFIKAANGGGTFDGDVGDRLTFQIGYFLE